VLYYRFALVPCMPPFIECAVVRGEADRLPFLRLRSPPHPSIAMHGMSKHMSKLDSRYSVLEALATVGL
jgi:hypothetical protein